MVYSPHKSVVWVWIAGGPTHFETFHAALAFVTAADRTISEEHQSELQSHLQIACTLRLA